MVADVYRRTGSLPSGSAALLREYCSELLRQDATGMDAVGTEYALRHLAHEGLLTGNGYRGYTRDQAIDVVSRLRDQLQRRNVVASEENILRALERCGILSQSGPLLTFSHDMLQDYFAARQVVERVYAGETSIEEAIPLGQGFDSLRRLARELLDQPFASRRTDS